MKPFISVVIPTCDRRELLKRCLDSLLTQTYPKDRYEIIVSDDGTTDEARKLVKYLDVASPKIMYIKSGCRAGSSHARNMGLHSARGEIVFFVDDDCVVDRDYINEIVRVLEEHKGIVGAGGRIYSDSEQQKNFIIRYMEALKGHPDTGLLIGANIPHLAGIMSYRRELLRELGGFDEGIRFVGEDYELLKRVQEGGHKVAYVPTAVVYHHQRERILSYLKHDCFGRGRGYLEYLLPMKGWALSSLPILGLLTAAVLPILNPLYAPMLLGTYVVGVLLVMAYHRGLLQNVMKEKIPQSLIFILFFIFVEFLLKIVGYVYQWATTLTDVQRRG